MKSETGLKEDKHHRSHGAIASQLLHRKTNSDIRNQGCWLAKELFECQMKVNEKNTTESCQ